jgi:hypothetical protein
VVRQLNSPLSLRKCALRLPRLRGGTPTRQDEINRPRYLYESAPLAESVTALSQYCAPQQRSSEPHQTATVTNVPSIPAPIAARSSVMLRISYSQCRTNGFLNSEVNIKYSLCLSAVALSALVTAASICQQLYEENSRLPNRVLIP